MVFITFLLSLLSGLLIPVAAPTASPVAVVSVSTVSNSTNSEQLAWTRDRRLSWDDFRGTPEEENPHHALTAANLAVDAKCRNGQFIYEVRCVFLPTQSWSKNKKSDKLLFHEQLHFDLTEVHARQLRQKLSKLANTCNKGQNSMSQSVSEAFREWKEEQKQFDQLSRHGLDYKVQQEWASNIETRLLALETYR